MTTFVVGVTSATVIAVLIPYLILRRRKAIADQVQARMLKEGKTPGTAVEVRILREGVELGRDLGWVSREGGALTFEGEFVRFGVVREDLIDGPPLASAMESSLRVKTNVGEVVLAFRAPFSGDSSFYNTFLGWPDAARSMPGPPISPKARTRAWYLGRCVEKMAASGNAALFPLFAVLANQMKTVPAIVACFLVILATIVARAKFVYRRVVKEDEEALARFAATDAPQNVVIEASTTGTGNPAVGAAVG